MFYKQTAALLLDRAHAAMGAVCLVELAECLMKSDLQIQCRFLVSTVVS